MKEFNERRKNERTNVLKQKRLNGQFFKLIGEVVGEEKWLWLRDGSIKRETESLIMAAQEHAIRTNAIKERIDSRIKEREKDKIKGYNDMKRELKKIWDMPVRVILK